MQLLDLIKPLESMSEEELREHLRTIRNNRTLLRPAAKAHAKKAAKKGSQGRVTKVEHLVGAMTEAEKAELLKQLGVG